MYNYNVKNPTTGDEIGEFDDPKYVKLYKQFVAQGSGSLREAIDVGIALEELDIADLKSSLLVPPPGEDITRILEDLLDGSYQHLEQYTAYAHMLDTGDMDMSHMNHEMSQGLNQDMAQSAMGHAVPVSGGSNSLGATTPKHDMSMGHGPHAGAAGAAGPEVTGHGPHVAGSATAAVMPHDMPMNHGPHVAATTATTTTTTPAAVRPDVGGHGPHGPGMEDQVMEEMHHNDMAHMNHGDMDHTMVVNHNGHIRRP